MADIRQYHRYEIINRHTTKEDRDRIKEEANTFFTNEIVSGTPKLSTLDLNTLAGSMYGLDLLRLKITHLRGRILAEIKRREKIDAKK